MRLQDLANEFNLQIILAGGTPQEELQLESAQPATLKQDLLTKVGKKAETADLKRVICPDCPTT